jgi:predicted RNA-binding protein with PUA-like domain
MPGRWLLKSDPDTYSFADLVKEKKTVWDGVANPVAVRHIRAMQKGDEALIYETGKVKSVVGVARVASDGRADPTDEKLAVVDVSGPRALARAVTLAEVKAEKALAHLPLVTMGRLSVMPIDDAAWEKIMAMAGEK